LFDRRLSATFGPETTASLHTEPESVRPYNDSGDKTHIVGDASHAGILPSRNALLSPSAFGGLSLLYRFCHQKEPFPDVCKDNWLEYKSMPLIKPERQARSESKADAKVQNACFNALYAAAGVEMFANDAVTHAGRHACQQEAKDSGLDGRLVDEALGYQIKDVQKDHYTPHVPIEFQLQRGYYSFREEDFPDVDSAQLRVLREHADVIRELCNLAVPDLPKREEEVAAIKTQAASSKRKDVMAQKLLNSASHKREHENFLALVRSWMLEAIVAAACRQRNFDGTIDYDQATLLEHHGSQPIYSAIRIPLTDQWLFSHPLFLQIASAVRHAEDAERTQIRTRDADTARATASVIAPQLERIEHHIGQAFTSVNGIRMAGCLLIYMCVDLIRTTRLHLVAGALQDEKLFAPRNQTPGGAVV